jgi:cell division protein FtsB
MSGYQIETIHDLIRILKDQPEWKEELRRLILTEELLALPSAFERFRQEEFKPLVERVDRIEGDVHVLKQDVAVLKEDVAVLKEDVAVLKQDVAILKHDVEILKHDVAGLKEDVAVLKEDVAGLKQDVEILKQDVAKLKTDVGDLKGDNFQRKVRENAAAYLGRLISRARVVPHEQLADVLEDAFDEGKISESERDDAIAIDLVVRGRLRHDKTREVLLATEVSVVADRHDLERAARRAAVIGRAYGMETIGVTVGQDRTEGAAEAADALDVVLIA